MVTEISSNRNILQDCKLIPLQWSFTPQVAYCSQQARKNPVVCNSCYSVYPTGLRVVTLKQSLNTQSGKLLNFKYSIARSEMYKSGSSCVTAVVWEEGREGVYWPGGGGGNVLVWIWDLGREEYVRAGLKGSNKRMG